MPIELPDEHLLDITDIKEGDLEEFARAIFRELFIEANGRGEHLTHDNEVVVFWETRFDHAFYKPKDWRETSEKQVVDDKRVERMPWILPLIGGEIANSECWRVNSKGRVKRMYVLRAKGYVVWLESRGEGQWTFSTGYVANTGYIYNQTRGQKRIWKK